MTYIPAAQAAGEQAEFLAGLQQRVQLALDSFKIHGLHPPSESGRALTRLENFRRFTVCFQRTENRTSSPFMATKNPPRDVLAQGMFAVEGRCPSSDARMLCEE